MSNLTAVCCIYSTNIHWNMFYVYEHVCMHKGYKSGVKVQCTCLHNSTCVCNFRFLSSTRWKKLSRSFWNLNSRSDRNSIDSHPIPSRQSFSKDNFRFIIWLISSLVIYRKIIKINHFFLFSLSICIVQHRPSAFACIKHECERWIEWIFFFKTSSSYNIYLILQHN